MKTIKRQLRRAFTIVELVIVIAVIAALAAVLIPTFVNVLNSANEANDVSMLYNINLALATESDIETPEQALDIAAEAGYNIEKLTPSSEGEIVYDEYTKTFALISTDGEVVYPTSNSSLADRLNAATTWYFASSEEDLTKSTTASYIITGTWNNGVVYEGTGQIDTSRATIYGGVVVGVQTVGSGAVNNVTVGSKKVATAETTNSNIIILNIVSGDVIYIYPSDGRVYKIYSDVNFNFSVADFSDYTNEGKGTQKDYIEYSKDDGITISGQSISAAYNYDGGILQLGTITYTYTGENITKTVEIEQSTNTNGKIILQLGTEEYPYLISDFNTYAEIAYARCGAEEGDIYFKLQNDVYITEQVKMPTDFYNSNSEAEDLACNIHFNLGGYNVYFVYTDGSDLGDSFNNAFFADSQTTGGYSFYNGNFKAVDSQYATLDSGLVCLYFDRCSIEFTSCNFDMVAFQLNLKVSNHTIYFNTCTITYKQTVNEENTALMKITHQTGNSSIIMENVILKVTSYYSMLVSSSAKTLTMSFSNVTFSNTIEKTDDSSEVYASLLTRSSNKVKVQATCTTTNCTFTTGNIAVDIYGNAIEE